ncbi:SusC/RagA family TonB-linked outer membrane protein [Flavitalea sp. BT771]|uniref:SusC/RagA family TonB-linked outer membrane protein n=1 Tax=Flavitalea sp. BT771 TaxID=3063329 RepID=UPI0026E16547|nr:SusC/RagA family TonB-linked outer membrane protein [Flavitalea sp. BT771]MDO6431837.1 SusC/RagA family TonB-linked outer membrane protein [Flavitalea sp. BT771]MDV6220746.1 SusC/RagA family TonB-linked outer membrane protein [Flavitalea sp. BT771]
MRKTLRLTVILLLSSIWAFPQTKDITGKITDSTGAPIAGASIKIKGIQRGTSASADGTFKITAPSNATLIISAVGFEPREISAGSADFFIQLHSSTSTLNEVVVTSLGIRREKRNLTYSAQEIKGESLVAAKQDNIVNGLAGKVSGVQITNTTGMPGSSSRIVIRGATSLTQENQPLFVVDGVPIDNNEAGSIDATGVGANNAALNQGSSSNRGIDLDPNIIESVTVLKGAAATALYGAAAARGAIIITTKQGARSGKPQVSVSSSYSISKPLYYDVQNKWAQGSQGVFIDGNGPSKSSFSWGPAVDTLHGANGQLVKTYDQQKMFFRTGHTTDNNISVSGANDKSRYLFSYSYLKNDGITPHTDFTRHSVFAKFTNQLGSKVTANFQMNYINTVNNRVNEGNGLANPLWTVFAAPITWNPHPDTLPDGTQNLYRSQSRNNSYFTLDNTGFVSTVNRFLPTATFSYNALPWLTITERIGADIYTDQSTYHESSRIINGTFFNNGGVSNRTQNYRQFNNDFIVEMHKDLTSDLNGSFLVGTNLLSRYSRFNTETGLGQNVDNFYNIATFGTVTSTDNISRYRKVGFYAQANLEYKKMLNLALTGRYDGTSVLNTDKSYYPYGSVAGGFIFSELLKGNPASLSFGKIRVSYSAVGNDNLAPYALTTNFAPATGTANNISYPYNGQSAFLISNVLGNPNLKNESLTEFETGLELKFMHNRLSFEGSYFIRKTKDLLTPVPIGPSSGYFTYNLNAGSMQDKGIELLVSGTPVMTRDFSWEVLATFTRIRNKVLKLAPNVSNIQFGGFGGGGGTYAFAGQPYGMLYGSTYLRDGKGNIIIDDDPSSASYGTPLIGDLAIIGNTNPDFLAGLTNTFTYKAITVSFLFDWRQGGDIFNLDDHYNWFYGTPKATENRAPRVLKGVLASDNSKPNDISISAQQYFTNVSNIDEACVEKGTYVKLRTASLSYSITPETLRKSPFKSVIVTLSGTNLFIYKPHFTSPDPEASISGNGNGQGVTNYMTPTTRNFILGVKLGL